MFKGLMYLVLCVVSISAVAVTDGIMIKQVGNDLVLSIEGEDIAVIDGFGSRSKEDQQLIFERATISADVCVTKSRWGVSLADEAKSKINNADHHISQLKDFRGKDSNVPYYVVVDVMRMIREAYRHGYKDPIQFGQIELIGCLTKGY